MGVPRGFPLGPDVMSGGEQVRRMPDRQGVEPLGNELLVNEFVNACQNILRSYCWIGFYSNRS